MATEKEVLAHVDVIVNAAKDDFSGKKVKKEEAIASATFLISNLFVSMQRIADAAEKIAANK